MRRSSVLLPAFVLVGVLFSVASAHEARAATTWTYPGASPCNTTLQACIDAASAGDTIQIGANDLTSQGASVTKSLTLIAEPGYNPTLYGIFVYDPPSPTSAMAVTLDGLGATEYIEGTFSYSGDSLMVRHATVTQSGTESGPDISVDALAPSSLQVINSNITVANEWAGIALAGTWTGQSTFRAVGNYITAHGSTYPGSAIELDTEAPGQSLQADIMNNAIWDVASCYCGGASGVFLYPQSTSTMDVNLVGNSFMGVQSSDINVRNELDAGGSGVLNAFNNIFAHATDAAFDMDDESSIASRFSLVAGTNDEFKNGLADILDGRSAGSGNLAVNPRFVSGSTGNLHLKSSSPLINAGQTCSPGGVGMLDAAGDERVFGSSMDLGAYERGSSTPTGKVFIGGSGADTITGTAGADIICGMGGNDVLNGGAGNDFIDGGSGSDKVTGGGGADWLYGGPDNDTICAKDGTSTDHLNGGPGTDGYQKDSGDVAVSVEHKVTC